MINGEYFLIKRKQEARDYELYENLPIQIIYTGDDLGWEDGFSRLIDTLLSYKPEDSEYNPISSKLSSSKEIPLPEILITKSPDEIRKSLASAADKFFENNHFDYKKYRDFCQKYDYAIHLSTRISPGASNDTWLGNRVTAELGKGNFGKVYSALDELQNPIAIKVAHSDVRDDEAMLNSFRRGVASMRYLSTSKINGIVNIIDASELPPSIIMEYVEGVDLEKFILDNYNLDPTKKLNIIKWISEILFECHTHEMVVLHRDLRPSNVRISGDYWNNVEKNNIRILDFDLSWFKGASGSEFYMNATQALGFLAPEQLDLKSKYTTKSALVDVYGIGMLLYFALSAEIPLASASSRADWPERIATASRRVYTKDWKSNTERCFRLIRNATLEMQEKRPNVQNVISEIEKIVSTMLGNHPLDEDSIAEEILYRLSPKGDVFDYLTRRGSFTTGGGVKADLYIEDGKFFGKIEYIANESSNRSNRGRYLESALSRASDKLSKIVHLDNKGTGTNLGGSKISFSFEPPASLKEIDLISQGLANAISDLAIKH